MKKAVLTVMMTALVVGLMAPASADPIQTGRTDFVACTDMEGNPSDHGNMVVSAQGLGFTSGPQVRLEWLWVSTLCGQANPPVNSEAFIEFQHGSQPSTWIYAGVCFNARETSLPCLGYQFTWGEKKLRREGIWHMKFTDLLIHTRYAMEIQRGMLCQDADYWVLRNPHGTYRLAPPAFQRCSLPT